MASTHRSALHSTSSSISGVQSAVEVINQVTKSSDTSHDAFVVFRFPFPPINPEPRRRRHSSQQYLPRQLCRQKRTGQGLHRLPRQVYPNDSHSSNLVIQPSRRDSKPVLIRWRLKSIWEHTSCYHAVPVPYESNNKPSSPLRSSCWRTLIGNHCRKTLRTWSNTRMAT